MTYKEQYKKEIKRIKRFIKRVEKRGYSFNFKEPQPPKRIRKESVEKLKKITPDKLYASATYNGLYSDFRELSGLEARKIERSVSAKKGAETRKRKEAQKKTPTYDFIHEIILKINELPDGRWVSYQVYLDFTSHKKYLISLINDRADISSQYNTLDKYINYLKDNEDRIIHNLGVITRDSKEYVIMGAFNELAEILKGTPLSFEEAKLIEELNQYYESFVDY